MHFFHVGHSFASRLGRFTLCGDLTRRSHGIQPWVSVGFGRRELIKLGGRFRNPRLEV